MKDYYIKLLKGKKDINAKRKVKITTKEIILALFSVLFSLTVFSQTTIYVNSSTGNDTSGDGTTGNPYKTFTKGYTSASSGDTLDLTGTFTWTDTDETGDAASSGYTLSKDLTIQGQGSGSTIIQAHSLPDSADRRVISLGNSQTVVIKDLTIRHGKLSGYVRGAGVSMGYSGNLTLTNCIIEQNYISVSITDNRYYGGGGISVWSLSTGSLTVDKCQIQNNYNTSPSGGGGAFHISMSDTNSGEVNITNSTINNNSADYGTGIYGRSPRLKMTNTTVFGNTGGIAVYLSSGSTNYKEYAFLTNVTIAHNSLGTGGFGITASMTGGASFSPSGVILKNNLIAQNKRLDNSQSDYNGSSITNNGYNLVEVQTGSTFTNGVNGCIVGVQSNLNLSSNLADNSTLNGTPTMALSAGSVAIDAGNNTDNGAVVVPSTDQRGLGRTGGVDIGSYELYIADITDPTLTLNADATMATDIANCFYTIQGTELDPSTATDDSGSLASLTYSLQKMAPNPNLISEDFDSGTWDTNNFELGTNTGSVVNGAYKSDTSSRGTLRSVAEFVPTVGNPLYVSATLSFTSGSGLAFFGTRSTGEQPSGNFNSEPDGLKFRIHNFNNGQTNISPGYDYQPRPGTAFYNNPVRFEIIDDGASINVTMTNLVTNVAHTYSHNTTYTTGSNRVVFSGDNSVSWDDIKISSGAHEYVQEYQNGSNSLTGITLNPGENTIVWTAMDAAGNDVSKSQIISVEDSIDPIVVTQNITITLDSNGEASITPSEINNNSTDNCGIDTIVLDKQDFTAIDAGENTLLLTITDINGNSNSETAVVTVINTDTNNDGLHDEAFVTTWKTDNSGDSNSTSITIPTKSGYTYNYDIDWEGDGTFDEFGLTGDATHNYSVAGTYTVQIKGTFPKIYFNGEGDYEKILTVAQWGTIAWENMSSAFQGCVNIQFSAMDAPDLSNVTNMIEMFYGATSFNSLINHWDVGNVTDMESMFDGAIAFNQDLNDWNVSSVMDMNNLFYGAMAFNGSIDNWDVSSVILMNSMFQGASNFNQDIGNWNVAAVTDMHDMFYEATVFNQDINNWNVSIVTDMSYMFREAIAFNQNLDSWNVGNVTNMYAMFREASIFNSNIGSWNVGNVTDMETMFEEALAFNQNINSWDVSSVLTMSDMFEGTATFNQPLDNWITSSVVVTEDMFEDAIAFNQPIANWDVSNIEDMNEMFDGASSFNQDLSNWDVSSVTDMHSMFYNAIAFNQDLSDWDFSQVTNMEDMFQNASLSVANYDALLLGLSVQTLQSNVPFNAGNSQYCKAAVERQFLIDTYGFTIIDMGQYCDEDEDGILDVADNCPTIANADQADNDADGQGDICDDDDDNDTIPDTEDAFPLDPDEDTDTDDDGTGNNADTDDDDDETPDNEDAFPLDSNEDTDTDDDGIGNNADTDDDDDETPDNEDAFPLDPDEDTDTDDDGTGNNADTDDDDDGTPDNEDAFPLDSNEDTDTDNDGTGDNADTDDDDDGTPDNEDAFPLDSNEDTDTDNDGTGDNEDMDDDGDGTVDDSDAFPLDPNEDTDSDNDGIGDNADTVSSKNNEPSLVPAEAFTPNGDGINDTWVIPDIDNYPNSVVTVYNRWGHEVFAAQGYQNNWKGIYRSNSQKLPTGSYMYVIDLRNGTAPIQGWLFVNY